MNNSQEGGRFMRTWKDVGLGIGMVIAPLLVVIGMLVMGAGCATLAKYGITNTPVVKQYAVSQVQQRLVKEGLSASPEEIGEWYDMLVSSKEMAALALKVQENAAVSNRACKLLEEYLTDLAPVLTPEK